MNKLVQLVTKLAAAFPRDNASEATMAVYVEQLHKCDIGILATVINEAIANSQRLPSVAEIRSNYRAHLARQGEPKNALPLGRSPMPPGVRKQLDEVLRKVDERSEELSA